MYDWDDEEKKRETEGEEMGIYIQILRWSMSV
jgi:hypothetical protein